MTAPAPEITAKSWLMVLTLGLVWGGTFLFQNLALRTTPPFWVASARIVFAGLLTYAVWRLRGGRLFTTSETDWPRLAAVALLSSALPFMLLSWGQQHVTSAFTGVSMATVALFVLPMAHVLVPGERMTWRRTLGFVLGFAGVVLLVGPEAFDGSGEALETQGRLACLAAAFCYAISSIMIRRLPPIDAFGLTFAVLGFGALAVVPVALASHGAPAMPEPQALAILALLGTCPHRRRKPAAHSGDPFGRSGLHEPDQLSGAAFRGPVRRRISGRSAARKPDIGDGTDPLRRRAQPIRRAPPAVCKTARFEHGLTPAGANPQRQAPGFVDIRPTPAPLPRPDRPRHSAALRPRIPPSLE